MGQARSRWTGSEHAARSNQMTAHGESLGRGADMAHQGGAFKLNSGNRFMHCPVAPGLPAATPTSGAGILARSPNLPISYTVCRHSIHFFRPTIMQSSLLLPLQMQDSPTIPWSYHGSAPWHGSCDSVNAGGHGAVSQRLTSASGR